jgi:hypothetical protein
MHQASRLRALLVLAAAAVLALAAKLAGSA